MTVVVDASLLVVLVNQDPRREVVRQQFHNWIAQKVDIHALQSAMVSQFGYCNSGINCRNFVTVLGEVIANGSPRLKLSFEPFHNPSSRIERHFLTD